MTQERNNPIVFKYDVVKYNKTSTIYQFDGALKNTNILTEYVKVEVYQGFSKAYNLGLYFRIKDQSAWGKSQQVTGMWKGLKCGYYYGDYKKHNIKTLLVFYLNEEDQSLKVFEFPFGYYPSKSRIDSIINFL